MTFEQCKIVIFNNIIFMKNIGKFSGKIQWKFSEIFRKNMKFSGQIFRLTSLHVPAEKLNAHYASTSPDMGYVPPSLRLTAAHNIPIVSEPEIFPALDQLRHTTAGHAQLPA